MADSKRGLDEEYMLIPQKLPCLWMFQKDMLFNISYVFQPKERKACYEASTPNLATFSIFSQEKLEFVTKMESVIWLSAAVCVGWQVKMYWNFWTSYLLSRSIASTHCDSQAPYNKDETKRLHHACNSISPAFVNMSNRILFNYCQTWILFMLAC